MPNQRITIKLFWISHRNNCVNQLNSWDEQRWETKPTRPERSGKKDKYFAEHNRSAVRVASPLHSRSLSCSVMLLKTQCVFGWPLRRVGGHRTLSGFAFFVFSASYVVINSSRYPCKSKFISSWNKQCLNAECLYKLHQSILKFHAHLNIHHATQVLMFSSLTKHLFMPQICSFTQAVFACPPPPHQRSTAQLPLIFNPSCLLLQCN